MFYGFHNRENNFAQRATYVTNILARVMGWPKVVTVRLFEMLGIIFTRNFIFQKVGHRSNDELVEEAFR